MERRRFVLGAAVALSPGCALIFTGAKSRDEQDREHIQWGFFVLDLLWVVTIVGLPIFGAFLIVDFATGAIYRRREIRTYDPDDLPDEELPDEPDELDVEGPLGACVLARERVVAGGIDGGAATAEWLADHLPACATCRAALVSDADARPVRIAGVVRARRRSARVELRPDVSGR